jgi:hypothetical protein
MSTREERRAIRRQKREMRRMLRKEKKSKFSTIVSVASTMNITIDLDTGEPKFIEAFNQFWPLLKPILEYAELVKITGPDTDKVIRTVIEIGERISKGTAGPGEESMFIRTLDTIWHPVKTVLGILITFTDDKVDKVINDIIEIGDWITEDKME